VTLRDVATSAGVSVSTASRSLSGDQAISAATRERVRAAAQALRYRPHAGARSLRTRSSRLIGVLVPTSGDAYYGEVVSGIELRARELGYQVLLAMSHSDPAREREAYEVFLTQRVDGMISVSPIGDAESMMTPAAAGLPAVAINWDVGVPSRLVDRVATGASRRLAASVRPLAPTSGNHVRFDDLAAAGTATDHLIGNRHRRFAFVCGPPARSSVLRLLGYRQALEAADLWPQTVLQPEPTLSAREVAVVDLLGRSRPPLAIVAYDDLTAIAALRAAHEVGWSVPGELSVVGIDDIELAEYISPSLTTVAQPKVELGGLAVEAALAGRRSGDQLLDGKLIVRASSGIARRRARP
jgi:DNA-binding LacI/PurR family transcriptional regulator